MLTRWLGALLVLVSLAVGASAYRLWTDETQRAAEAERHNHFARAFGNALEDPEPDRAPAFAVGGVAAVLFLAGVIVLVVPQPRNSTKP